MLYPFCSFIHKKREKSYKPWRGTGCSNKPVLWENIWVIYQDFTFWRLIYTHFKTKEIQIAWHHSLQVGLLSREWWQARKDVDQEKPGVQHARPRFRRIENGPEPTSNPEKLTSSRETENQDLGTCSERVPDRYRTG